MTTTYFNGKHVLTQAEFDYLKQNNQLVANREYIITDNEFYATNEDLNLKQNIIDNSLTTTDKTIVGAVNEVNSNKSVKPVVTTYTVDTPVWTNQPTISGSLDLTFVDWNTNYYYVTLKDASGNALPSGQFKLTLTRGGFATAINQIFSLTSLNTGNSGTLTENSLIEFKTIGAGWAIRDAYSYILMPSKSLNRKITVVGLFLNGGVGSNYISYSFIDASIDTFRVMVNNGGQIYNSVFYVFPAISFADNYKYSALAFSFETRNLGASLYVTCKYTSKQGMTRDQWLAQTFDGTVTQEVGRNGYIIKKDLTTIIDSDINTPILRGYFANGTNIIVEDY